MGTGGAENRGEFRLKASVDRDYGMQFVDLFVDHTHKNQGIRIISSNNKAITMSDHLKLLLTPVTCPSCGSQEVKRSHRWSLKQWFLKFSGRKLFLCLDCGFKQTAKVGKWEWETICTVSAITLTFLVMSIHWVLR
ncbi:MAG: hypothetical protein C0392_04285 [Syntrophus sp. (in: bacteria)]|nr:hypothetical protein [Syntrophus sp. (in: bacteria)]